MDLYIYQVNNNKNIVSFKLDPLFQDGWILKDLY